MDALQPSKSKKAPTTKNNSHTNRLGSDGPRPVQETVSSEGHKQSVKQSATVSAQRCYSECESVKVQRHLTANNSHINRLGSDGPKPVQETVSSEGHKLSVNQSATVSAQRCYSECETVKVQRHLTASATV